MSRKPTAPVQRLDRWLWFARIFKSRTLAAQLIEDGKVRVNRMRVVKPSHGLREGDVLTVTLRGRVQVLKVLAPGTRRGPPPEAKRLYQLVSTREPSAPNPAGDAQGRDAHTPASPARAQRRGYGSRKC